MDAEAGSSRGWGVRTASRWSDADTWVGGGLRREVFFFRSGHEQLYGSLYAAVKPSRSFGLVTCNSWGVEADRADPLQRSVALGMARLGGAGLVFHYPGYGDSFGDLEDVDLTDLGNAAVAAVEEAARRCPGLTWILAGFMLGASVACLAQEQVAVEQLLLVQPSLRPGAYFERLAKRTGPLAPGPSPRAMVAARSAPDMAYGYPIPSRILERAAEADTAVGEALATFEGEGAVVRHMRPEEPLAVPERFEQIDAPGTWRFGSLNNPNLAEATIAWLDERTGDAAR